MDVSINRSEGTAIATVVGEIDADNCQEFASSVLDGADGADRLVVDVGGLTFIDSSGISELLKLREQLADRGAEFELRNPSTTVRRVLEITGLLEHFGLS